MERRSCRAAEQRRRREAVPSMRRRRWSSDAGARRSPARGGGDGPTRRGDGVPQRGDSATRRPWRRDNAMRRWRRARRRPKHGGRMRGRREAAAVAPSFPIPSPNPVRSSHGSSSPSSPIPSHISPLITFPHLSPNPALEVRLNIRPETNDQRWRMEVRPDMKDRRWQKVADERRRQEQDLGANQGEKKSTGSRPSALSWRAGGPSLSLHLSLFLD
jgi:hypothetical protein